MNKLTNLNFFLIWVFGFFVLLSFDLFVEGFVFEWLEWNGTNKNDWFFVLWWGLVVVWFLNGSISLYQKLKDEGFGKESCATFFHTKKESKKYHIDYIYSKNLNPLKLKVGSYAEWISYSDHSPLIAELG